MLILKEISKHDVEELSYLLIYVPYQYRTQQMCEKAFFENGGTLNSVPDYYKVNKCVIKQLIIFLVPKNLFLNATILKKMCKEAINTHSFTILFVLECYKTQKLS